jgi:hypothetical protein
MRLRLPPPAALPWPAQTPQAPAEFLAIFFRSHLEADLLARLRGANGGLDILEVGLAFRCPVGELVSFGQITECPGGGCLPSRTSALRRSDCIEPGNYPAAPGNKIVCHAKIPCGCAARRPL